MPTGHPAMRAKAFTCILCSTAVLPKELSVSVASTSDGAFGVARRTCGSDIEGTRKTYLVHSLGYILFADRR